MIDERIDALTRELHETQRKLKEAQMLVSHYEKEGHEGWKQYHEQKLVMEEKVRVFSDMARKFGLVEYHEDLKMETVAELEVRNLSHLSLEKIVDFVDLHSALSRQFAELARKKASELDINETRIKRAKERSTAAEIKKAEPAVRKAKEEKLSEDRTENKALKALMRGGIGYEMAVKMLEQMKGNK